MQIKTMRKLEFSKVIERLMDCCTFQIGRDLAQGLKPFSELADAVKGLQETSEAKELLRLYPTLPLGGLRDIRSALRRVEMGGMLQPGDLLDLSGTLNGGRRLKKFMQELLHKYPLLKEQGEAIGIFKELEDSIGRCIGDDAEILDQASAELGSVRKQIKNLQFKIKDRLEHIIRGSEFQKYLQDPIITVRDDRYVIPVKQEYRNQIPGIVHDQSSSGATLFIEPMAVVEMDNELRRLTAREHQEVEKILRELTRAVGANLEPVKATLETLGYLDFVFAKGKLSSLMDAGEPKLNKHGSLNIILGRHPLITGRPVPVSLHLGRDFDTLVITGPNTGGKTVTLKTVGLFCIMAAAGLHVPAEHGTELSMFDRIFADIGDEQSIEQSLSTFSSHMTNIVEILKQVDCSSLVLLDEVGAGTDPAEGAALAMSILKYLQDKGARTVATTHYSELKTFAYNNPRVENASVEFDVATLRPTYRLLIGMPGRSNAFEIAGRLGLNHEVVSQARSYMSEQETKVADLLQNLEETKRATQRDREEAAQLRRELENGKLSLEAERLKLTNKEREVLEKASREATKIVQQAKQEAEEVVSQLKHVATEERVRLHAINEARDKLKKLEQETTKVGEENRPVAPGLPLKTVRLGQSVEIPEFKQKGYILSEPNSNGEVLVQVGIMKINLNLADLRTGTEHKVQASSTGAGRLAKGKVEIINKELDLRGLTVDEATYEVDKYLDDAVLSGLDQVHLIHGKGTGALRSAISEHLSRHPHVKAFRLGQFGEGGSGVSVVDLK